MLRSFSKSALVVVLFSSLLACARLNPSESGTVEQAFANHQSNTRVEGSGGVERILADDTSGLPHQRFILRLASGQTVVIEHNTDVAPRINDLKLGDTVTFAGEYVWNEQGGLVHWTHHDPVNKHADGWLRHNDRVYQ
jgi:Protein of unknown function (DUF3465)